MKQRILLTTTSYQDTPGPHHDLLASAGFEVIKERGPLSEERMLELVGDLDGFLCGDDGITQQVIEKALPRLKVISKYGIGLDKIDVDFATSQKIPVLFTPGVNHTTVAEHTIALILASFRKLVEEVNHVSKGNWTRITGNELWKKTIGLVGMGRIGQEVAKRARAFEMNVVGFGSYWDDAFAEEYGIERKDSLHDLLECSDIVSLHTKLSKDKVGMIGSTEFEKMKPGAVVINCARGELIDYDSLLSALKSEKISYATDVLHEEPPPEDYELLKMDNVIVTPHIGSRTHESVARQATMATENLIRFLNGEKPLAQSNSF